MRAVEREAAVALATPELTEPVKLVMVPAGMERRESRASSPSAAAASKPAKAEMP